MTRQFKRLGLALIAILISYSNSQAQPKELPPSYTPRDTVFNEIVLTDEGVKAIDTAGYEWHYDFESATFVSGAPPALDEGMGTTQPDLEYNGVPIEERATVQKKVRHFEMGAVTVRADEYVDGDIQALDMVTIKGWVRGNVVSIRDRVLITETGQVDGNVEAPKVLVKKGGVVLGEINESSVPLEFEDLTSGFSHQFLLVMIIITLSFLFLGFIVLVLMPRQVANMESCIAQFKGKSASLGFLIMLVMPAIIVLMAITIIGLVLVPLLPFVYFWGIVLGIVATGKGVGAYAYSRIYGGKASPVILGAMGIIILMAPWLATGALMGTTDGFTYGLGIFFLVLSIIISIFPVFAGIGAAFLTRFGFRKYVAGAQYIPRPGASTAPAPAPPPIPDAPFVQNQETPRSDSRISGQE